MGEERQFKNNYLKAKDALLNDASICKENRILFNKFFEFEEYKLKRINGLSNLDNRNYKTLNLYVQRFRNVNKWFLNKPWIQITKQDIKKVYDDLEDGKILTKYGVPFKSRNTYYSKIFKSKPFELAEKSEIAKQVIQFTRKDHKEVRFVIEEDFKKL